MASPLFSSSIRNISTIDGIKRRSSSIDLVVNLADSESDPEVVEQGGKKRKIDDVTFLNETSGEPTIILDEEMMQINSLANTNMTPFYGPCRYPISYLSISKSLATSEILNTHKI